MRAADHVRVEVTSRAELRAWLTRNHKQADSIWLVTWKAATRAKHVPYDDIVEECLCFGWIDSLPRKLDDTRTMLRLSPRNPKSKWSGANKRRVAKLEAAGLMHESGRTVIARAKTDGTWDALDAVEALEVPDDLAAALQSVPEADKNFASFPPSARRGILEWIASAKTASTRARRVTETAVKAGQNVRANTPRQPKGVRKR